MYLNSKWKDKRMLKRNGKMNVAKSWCLQISFKNFREPVCIQLTWVLHPVNLALIFLFIFIIYYYFTAVDLGQIDFNSFSFRFGSWGRGEGRVGFGYIRFLKRKTEYDWVCLIFLHKDKVNIRKDCRLFFYDCIIMCVSFLLFQISELFLFVILF